MIKFSKILIVSVIISVALSFLYALAVNSVINNGPMWPGSLSSSLSSHYWSYIFLFAVIVLVVSLIIGIFRKSTKE